jgi:predicted porin
MIAVLGALARPMAVAGGVIGLLFCGSAGVKAADLGGDCCADLEERVAELEATTVTKGNKKTKVELYGRVNRVFMFWDDGFERNAYSVNNSYNNNSRIGIRGKGKISDDLSSLFVIEFEDRGDQSKFVNQFNDNPDQGLLNVRKSAVGIESKTWGRVWFGLQEMAKDNINKDTIVIKAIDQSMNQDFYMNWSFFLRPKGAKGAEGMTNIRYQDIARCYSTANSTFDCSTRRNEVRYDTPEFWGGFVGSASWGEDDIWSASLRFQKDWDKWRIGAGYAYEDFTDELVNNGGGGVPFQDYQRHLKEWAGTFSVLHKPSGLWVWGSNSNSQDDDIGAEGFITGKAPPVMHAWDIAGGIHRDFFAPGKTTIWGGYTVDQDGIGGFTRTTVPASVSGTASSYSVWNGRIAANRIPGIGFDTEITGAETTKWYAAIDQAIDSAALNLYVAYQHITPDISLVTNSLAFSPNGKIKSVPIELDDFDVVFMGGRLSF